MESIDLFGLDRLEFVESIFRLPCVQGALQILHELVVGDKIIKMFSIHLWFDLSWSPLETWA